MNPSLPDLELVSFHLCPYVHRAVITLKEKKVPFRIREIDLSRPPEWFQKISPAGRVPVLLVDREVPVFESAVINEYLDEITEPRLGAADPLQRARERAWIAYGSELMGEFYAVYTAREQGLFEGALSEFFESLSKLEPEIRGPFFRGAAFSLVDTSYAPLFARLRAIPLLWNHEAWKAMPRVKAWAERLLGHPSVIESCAPDFEEGIVAYVKENSPFLIKETP